jgi:hypothetical protein
MKTYLVVSGTLFGLVVIAHVLRLVQEGTAPIAEPIFVISTLICACLCVWAFALLRTAGRRTRSRYPRM